MEPILLDVPDRLESPRLLLRIPRGGDGQRLSEAVTESAAELARWMPWAVPTPTVTDIETWCRNATVKYFAREQFHFRIELKETGACVGVCGINRTNWKVPMVEIGYWLRTPYCGKGYMTEAVLAVTALALDVMKAARVEIRCDEKNRRSALVADRAGFTLEGVLRNEMRDHRGSLRDTSVYAKLG
jgi:RimJ/RimL family protein N-acetyltransferase